MFNQMKIGTRLYFGFGVIIVVTALLTLYAIFNMAGEGRTLMLGVLCAVVSLGAVFAWYLTRSIVLPLRDAMALAEAVAIGNAVNKVANDAAEIQLPLAELPQEETAEEPKRHARKATRPPADDGQGSLF